MKSRIRFVLFLSAVAWMTATPSWAEDDVGYCVTEQDGTHMTTKMVCDAEGGDWFGPEIPPSG